MLKLRSTERYLLKKLFLLQSVQRGIAAFLPHLFAILIFIMFIIFRPGELSTPEIFFMLSIFGALILPIKKLMASYSNKLYADIGCSRAIKLLKVEDHKELKDSEELQVGEIILNNCSFSVEKRQAEMGLS